MLLAASLWADGFVARAGHLYVAFGLVTAIGVPTAGWTPAVVMVQRQWRARLGLALGIAGSGVGLAARSSLQRALASPSVRLIGLAVFLGPHFGAIFGATQVASALGGALGAWLAGRLFDATGSDAIASSVAAGAAVVAALSAWARRMPRAEVG